MKNRRPNNGTGSRKAYIIRGFLIGDTVSSTNGFSFSYTANVSEADDEGKVTMTNEHGQKVDKNGDTLVLLQYYDPVRLAVVDRDMVEYDSTTPFSGGDHSWSHVIDLIMDSFRKAKDNADIPWPDEEDIYYELENTSAEIYRRNGGNALMAFLAMVAEDMDYWVTCSSFEDMVFNEDGLTSRLHRRINDGADPLDLVSVSHMTTNDIRIINDLPFDEEEKDQLLASSRPWRVIASRLKAADLPLVDWLPFLRAYALFGSVDDSMIRTLTALMRTPGEAGNSLVWKMVNHRQDPSGAALRKLVKRYVCRPDDKELMDEGLPVYQSKSIGELLLYIINDYYADSREEHHDDYHIKDYRVSTDDVDWFNKANDDAYVDELVSVFSWIGDHCPCNSDDGLDIGGMIRAIEPKDSMIDSGLRTDKKLSERFMTLALPSASIHRGTSVLMEMMEMNA